MKSAAAQLRDRAKAAFDAGKIGAGELARSLQRARQMEREYDSDWTASEDEALRRAVIQGKSYESISHMFTNRTRNACLGRARRIGLSHPA